MSYLLSYPPHLTCSHTRHILLAIILATDVLITILLIVVMLITPCSSRRTHRVVLLVSYSSYRTQYVVSFLPTFLCFHAKCGSSIYRCTLDIKNRTGLSHYAWNPLYVYEYNESICCDVLYLDSQHDCNTMTCVVWLPFALTRLYPEGKCPDTAASRRKIP